ncbi:MAG: D-aminoacylase [Desulfobacteraceae bacterium]|nr:D-aminoacylase [Desulfobacteraceae bacterium]
MYDILIKNGEIIDGTGRPRVRMDLALRKDTIVEMGTAIQGHATATIDAAGSIVSPGFIDMHSHADFSLPAGPADSLTCQGVTTAVIGQCGETPAPLLSDTRSAVIGNYQTQGGALPWDRWSDFGSYLNYLKESGLTMNIVSLAGQGTIRAGVMGYSAKAATPDQITAMQAQVEKVMESGAFGISTGLIYPPGSYATTEELIEVVRPVTAYNGYYFSHIRGEDHALLDAVAEAIRIGRETGARVQISHHKVCWPRNWDIQEKALALIDDAIAEGMDVSADVYPYVAASTGLSNNLPDWAHEGGKPAILERLSDPDTRRQMISDMRNDWDGSWEKVMISRCPTQPEFEGRFISELALSTGQEPEVFVFDALLSADLNISVVLFLISENNLQQVMSHPAVMIGSDSYGFTMDGREQMGLPHPRSFGTFPRVLGRYVRDLGVIPLETAVHKMTGLAAQKMGLTDRGRIASGLKADLVVFDPALISDPATFENPFQPPTGVRHVICNGEFVVHDGYLQQHLPGRIIKNSTASRY